MVRGFSSSTRESHPGESWEKSSISRTTPLHQPRSRETGKHWLITVQISLTTTDYSNFAIQSMILFYISYEYLSFIFNVHHQERLVLCCGVSVQDSSQVVRGAGEDSDSRGETGPLSSLHQSQQSVSAPRLQLQWSKCSEWEGGVFLTQVSVPLLSRLPGKGKN